MTRLVLFAALLLVAAHNTNAQPPNPTTTDTLVGILLDHIGTLSFQKELGLTPEQEKTLIAHRQKLWDEVYAMSPALADKSAAAREAETASVFKNVLTPEQFKRATQLAAREVWITGADFGWQPEPTRVRTDVLRVYPELTAVLKLSDEQSKLVSAASAMSPGLELKRGQSGGRFFDPGVMIYLTPQQSAVAKALLGEPTRTMMYGVPDPRSDIRSPAGRGLVELTQVTDVRKHLGITSEQQSKLAGLSLPSPGFGGGRGAGGRLSGLDSISPAARKKITDIFDEETRIVLATILKPEQLTRLEQIRRRSHLYPGLVMDSRREVDFLYAPGVELALAYTTEQYRRFDAVFAAHDAAVAKAMRANLGFEATEKAIKESITKADQARFAILTPTQMAKYKELCGEPFQGSIRPETTVAKGSKSSGGGFIDLGGGGFGSGGGFGGAPGVDLSRQFRERDFGHYARELSLIGRDKGLETELKLTDEQVKKLRYATFEFSEQFLNGNNPRNASVSNSAADRFIDKSLADILTPEQSKRFRQIMLQSRERPTMGTWTTIRSAVSYPGVAEEVKLTAEQKDKLFDGTDPDAVLTANQKDAIKTMLGEPYKNLATLGAQVFGGGGGGGFGPGVGGPGRSFGPPITPVVLTLPWDALKLNPEQGEKLAAAANRYSLATTGEPRPSGKGPGWPAGSQAPGKGQPALVTQTKQSAAFEKEVADILTAEQKARFEPLLLQQFAAQSGLQTALAREDVAKRVKLTDDQTKQIQAAEEELRKFAGLLDTAEIDYVEETALRVLLQDRLDARIDKILTDEQKAAWKELIGEPWAGFKKSRLRSNPTGRFGGGFGN